MDGFGRTVLTESADNAGNVQSETDVQYAACACSPMGKVSQKSLPARPWGLRCIGRSMVMMAWGGRSA